MRGNSFMGVLLIGIGFVLFWVGMRKRGSQFVEALKK
jgi:hypothetical protein